MKEIKATAPTPQDWIELVRENERLKRSQFFGWLFAIVIFIWLV